MLVNCLLLRLRWRCRNMILLGVVLLVLLLLLPGKYIRGSASRGHHLRRWLLDDRPVGVGRCRCRDWPQLLLLLLWKLLTVMELGLLRRLLILDDGLVCDDDVLILLLLLLEDLLLLLLLLLMKLVVFCGGGGVGKVNNLLPDDDFLRLRLLLWLWLVLLVREVGRVCHDLDGCRLLLVVHQDRCRLVGLGMVDGYWGLTENELLRLLIRVNLLQLMRLVVCLDGGVVFAWKIKNLGL